MVLCFTVSMYISVVSFYTLHDTMSQLSQIAPGSLDDGDTSLVMLVASLMQTATELMLKCFVKVGISEDEKVTSSYSLFDTLDSVLEVYEQAGQDTLRRIAMEVVDMKLLQEIYRYVFEGIVACTYVGCSSVRMTRPSSIIVCFTCVVQYSCIPVPLKQAFFWLMGGLD